MRAVASATATIGPRPHSWGALWPECLKRDPDAATIGPRPHSWGALWPECLKSEGSSRGDEKPQRCHSWGAHSSHFEGRIRELGPVR
eukprot:6180662-Pyramimonas_sp.AAC.1